MFPMGIILAAACGSVSATRSVPRKQVQPAQCNTVSIAEAVSAHLSSTPASSLLHTTTSFALNQRDTHCTPRSLVLTTMFTLTCFLICCIHLMIRTVATVGSLASCLSGRKVPVSLPSSPNFATLAEPYNLRLQYVPAAIVLPTTTQHISSAILCAAKAKVKVQAKSGGHS